MIATPKQFKASMPFAIAEGIEEKRPMTLIQFILTEWEPVRYLWW